MNFSSQTFYAHKTKDPMYGYGLGLFEQDIPAKVGKKKKRKSKNNGSMNIDLYSNDYLMLTDGFNNKTRTSN